MGISGVFLAEIRGVELIFIANLIQIFCADFMLLHLQIVGG